MTGILYRKETKWATYIALCSLFVVIAWNYFFIPRWGLIGAATSNLAGFLVRIGLIYFVSQGLFHIPFEMKRLALVFSSAASLYLISQALSFPSPYLTFLVRAVFAGLFPIILLFLGFYYEGEKEYLRKAIQKASKAIAANCSGVREA
jgi:O-antigen/teichoic acid export membrane protein